MLICRRRKSKQSLPPVCLSQGQDGCGENKKTTKEKKSERDVHGDQRVQVDPTEPRGSRKSAAMWSSVDHITNRTEGSVAQLDKVVAVAQHKSVQRLINTTVVRQTKLSSDSQKGGLRSPPRQVVAVAQHKGVQRLINTRVVRQTKESTDSQKGGLRSPPRQSGSCRTAKRESSDS